MDTKSFEVKIYFSSFCTFHVKAENRDQAIIKARNLNPPNDELLANLENWEEADEAELVRQ